MYTQPTTHVRLDTLHTLVFPDGSVLRGCRRRGYLPRPGQTGLMCEWFLFGGKQFSRKELDRWCVLVFDEGRNAADDNIAISVRAEMRARTMLTSLRFSDQSSREFQTEMQRLYALVHLEEQQQGKEAACQSTPESDSEESHLTAAALGAVNVDSSSRPNRSSARTARTIGTASVRTTTTANGKGAKSSTHAPHATKQSAGRVGVRGRE